MGARLLTVQAPLRTRLALVALVAAALLAANLAPALAAVGDDVPSPYPLDSLPPSARDNAILQWNEEALECIRLVKPPPTVVARALAIVHTATYDAWAAYDANALGTRYGDDLRQPPWEWTTANKTLAISHAARLTLLDLFPACAPGIEDRWADLGHDDPEADSSDPADVGTKAAEAVIEFRRHDGANQVNGYADTTGYKPVNGPDTIVDPWRWQPLRVPTSNGGSVVQRAATPHWSLVTPFALTDAPEYRPVPPSRDPARTTLDILRESAELDDRRKVVAEYWADGPASELPPGHWNLFAQWVSRERQHTLDDDAKLFFALDSAMLDASIRSWTQKYLWDSARPITAIHGTMDGRLVLAWAGPYQGTRKIRAQTWRPYQQATVVTPPFPEHTSGHSTFSAAAAEVLATFTGSDKFGASVTIAAGTSVVEPRTAVHPGVPAADVQLVWDTFSDAADEAGISRRYGGIHFIDGDLQGRYHGRRVGEDAYDLAERYWEGKAAS